MASDDSLKEYRDKRDFRRTAEPAGGSKRSTDKPIFVIQKHAATSLHYDFRLEVGGVLKSWAVPKGPSTDPGEKRLAVPTEDHPLEYAEYEGVIPEEEYGAGTVLVWDIGSYRNLRAGKDDEGASMDEALEDGKLEVWLDGEKIRGGYALIRTGSGQDSRWLLVKMDDEEADARRNPTSTEPKSVLSNRTLEEIRDKEGDRQA
ncbi:MAG TPA: DNA polymerase ligase N-terminal domain-containing protein [Anaerolineales bacterium]|jgi:DNA ligase D-like protein (predicted 3'-phosphoesterase)|nr:DNA polymerase ligase N-terminal domain-containing protein [Anaerolineales bacterium]